MKSMVISSSMQLKRPIAPISNQETYKSLYYIYVNTNNNDTTNNTN